MLAIGKPDAEVDGKKDRNGSALSVSAGQILATLGPNRSGMAIADVLAALGLALAVAAAPASAQVSDRPELPERLAGVYASDAAACRNKLADSRITISPMNIAYYESTALPREVIVLPDGTVLILADHDGEGDSWTTMSAFALSADGQHLTIFTPADGQVAQLDVARVRCPQRK